MFRRLQYGYTAPVPDFSLASCLAALAALAVKPMPLAAWAGSPEGVLHYSDVVYAMMVGMTKVCARGSPRDIWYSGTKWMLHSQTRGVLQVRACVARQTCNTCMRTRFSSHSPMRTSRTDVHATHACVFGNCVQSFQPVHVTRASRLTFLFDRFRT